MWKSAVKTVFVSFLLINLLSCHEAKVKDINEKDTISYSTSNIVIKLDKFTPFSDGMVLSEIFNDELIISNQINKSIDRYSLKNGELISRIKIDDHEELKGLKLAGAKVIDSEKILIVFNYFISRSALFDFSGKIIKNDIFSFADSKQFYNLVVYNGLPIIVKDSIYYISGWPIGKTSREKFLRTSWCELNIETSELKMHNLPYPSNLSNLTDKSGKDFLAILVYKTVSNDGTIIWGWPGSNSLGIQSGSDLDSIIFVQIKNNKVSVEASYRSLKPDLKYMLDYPTFISMFYDRINNCFYRIGLFPTTRSMECSPITYQCMLKKDVVIQIIDSDFREIGAIYLPHSIYDVFHSFVYNGILYISNNNLFNPNLNEDQLVFTGFNFYSD